VNLDDSISIVRTEGAVPDGPLIGKYLSRDKFERSLPLGPALADFAFAYDLAGTPQLGWWADWRQPFLGDIHQRPDLDTLTLIRPGVASCIVDFVGVDGTPLPVCPRSVLRSVVERLATNGFTAKAACEVEGMAFTESYAEAKAKGFKDLTPLGVAHPLAYLTHDSYRMRPLLDEVMRRLDLMGISWEAWSAEAAPGQFEINLPATDPVSAADATVRVRNVCREVAVDLGMSVTFMAKPTDSYGSGMHIHHSLLRDASPAFYDATSPDGRTKLMRNWIGGLIATMPAAHSFLTPTINSFRRMVGFAAAPLVVSWGEDNKSTALRVISRSEKLSRVEHRLGAGDLNPYLGLAAILSGGIVGIEQAIEPPDELRALAWGLPDRFPYLPTTITGAADALDRDKAFADVMGPVMVEHWVNTRRWEWMMYHTTGGDPEAESVTDWELERYFELM